MSELPSRVANGFVRSFREIVDRVDPHDLVSELVQRRILPLSHLEQQSCEKRSQAMMKLLGKVHRQSLVDPSTYADFVGALDNVNTRDSGHKYEDIVEELRFAGSDLDSSDAYPYLPFNEVERRVFDCTRRVAERSLESDSVLPDLVSAGAISIDECAELIERKDRLEQVHRLMDIIASRGSHALRLFVRTLLESEDRSARGVGQVIQSCLEAQQESPYTPREWLGKSFYLVIVRSVLNNNCLCFCFHFQSIIPATNRKALWNVRHSNTFMPTFSAIYQTAILI